MSLTFFSYFPRIMPWLSEQDLSPVSRVILVRWSLAFKADMPLADLLSLAGCIVILGPTELPFSVVGSHLIRISNFKSGYHGNS
jgi:hypothetical protein